MTRQEATCPPEWAGLFGVFVAHADASGRRLTLTLAQGVAIPILPEFAALPVTRVIDLLWAVTRGAFSAACLPLPEPPCVALGILLSSAPCPQADARSTRAAAGGDLRTSVTGTGLSYRGDGATPAGLPPPGAAAGVIEPFPGGRK